MPGPGRFTRENNSFGNFSSPARSSRWKREKQSFRVIVCYRSNDRNRFPSLLPPTLAPSLSLSLSIFSFFFCNLFRSLCIVWFLSPSLPRIHTPRPHTNPLFHPRGSLFSLQIFSYFCRSISRRQDFTDSWFHLVRLFESLFNSHCIFDSARTSRPKRTGLRSRPV